MTAQTIKATAPVFDQSTPAKLSRSLTIMSLLLFLATAFFTFSWYQEHTQLEALRGEVALSITSGYSLMTEFKAMGQDAEEEFTGDGANARAAASDYGFWRYKAIRDLESAMRIRPEPDPFVMLAGKPSAHQHQLAEVLNKLNSSFIIYLDSIHYVRSLAQRGDRQAALANYKSAAREMKNNLFPSAQSLYESGEGVYKQTVADYSLWQKRLTMGTYICSVVLLLFIGWRYWFILFRGDRAILQGTIITFLLVAAVCGYAYEGIKAVDVRVQKVVVEIYPTATSTARLQQLSAPSLKTTALVQDIANVRSSEVAMVGQVGKAAGRIQFLLAAPFLLFLAGLFYKLAVTASLRDYR